MYSAMSRTPEAARGIYGCLPSCILDDVYGLLEVLVMRGRVRNVEHQLDAIRSAPLKLSRPQSNAWSTASS